MKRAVLLLAILAGCGTPAPKVPAGMTVVRQMEPPPPVETVQAAQERLRRSGTYDGPADGQLTPATRVALAQFQRQAKIPVTGALDPRTVAALGLPPLPMPGTPTEGAEQRTAAQAGTPTAESLLTEREQKPAPQPPPGALAPAYASAAQMLATGAGQARTDLASGPLPAATARAQSSLSESRARAFSTVLEARLQKGYAPLPPQLQNAMERELSARALLVNGRDGQFGSDDAAAIRWVERSLGLPTTGRPSLRLLEEMGIDPSPMFVPP